MAWLAFPFLAVAPGLFWLWFYTRLDRYHPAPRRLIAWSFVLGMFSVIPAGILEFLIIPDGALNRGVSIAVISLVMLGVVGPVEETCKFLAVRLRAYRSPYFEEPMDGLVHAAAASLGFASLENLLYILDYGPEVMIIRAPLSTLGHLIFGSLWGYALGLRHEGGDARLVWRGLGLAALLHGLFNVAVSLPLGLLWGAIIVLVGATRAYREFKRTQSASPFRYRRNVPLVVCANCDTPTRVSNRYCNACGVGVAVTELSTLICGNCRRAAPPSTYCGGCGDRLLS